MQASVPFKMATIRNYQQMPDLAVSSFSQYVQEDLPQVGYLSAVYVQIIGSITTGTGTSGSWDANYWPWNLFKRLQLTTNQGFLLFDMDGYQAMLVDSIQHRAQQNTSSPPASGGFNNTSNQGPRTGRAIFPTGALADTTTYRFNIFFRIPVAVDDGLSAGLILLENQATKVTLNCQLGAAADFGTLGTGATIAATIRPLVQLYSVPLGEASQPNTDYVHQWLQQDIQWTATGDQIYEVPIGGILSRIIVAIKNNGAPQPFFATASRPDTPNLGNLTTQYAGSMRPEVLPFMFRLQQMFEWYGYDLPQGVLVYDYSILQSLELGYDPTQVFDTGLLTEFSTITNITATPTNGLISYTRELLQRRVA